MIDFAVTVWVLALVATTAVFVGVVVVQGVARAARRVRVTPALPVVAVPAPRSPLEVDARVAA